MLDAEVGRVPANFRNLDQICAGDFIELLLEADRLSGIAGGELHHGIGGRDRRRAGASCLSKFKLAS